MSKIMGSSIEATPPIPAVQPGDTATVWLDREYADAVDIRQVTPEPLSVTVEPIGWSTTSSLVADRAR